MVIAFVVAAACFLAVPAAAWDNGVALTPPMGFANWNVFGCNYDDALFREMSDTFVSSGLAAKGYECVCNAHARSIQFSSCAHGLTDIPPINTAIAGTC